MSTHRNNAIDAIRATLPASNRESAEILLDCLTAAILEAVEKTDKPTESQADAWRMVWALLNKRIPGWTESAMEGESHADCACRLLYDVFDERDKLASTVPAPSAHRVAWLAVCDVLDNCRKGWLRSGESAMDGACRLIRESMDLNTRLTARVSELEALHTQWMTQVQEGCDGRCALGECVCEKDGWTVWPGGDCPFEEPTPGVYKLRAGDTMTTSNLRSLAWNHTGCASDVIAYKVDDSAPTREEILAAYKAAGLVPEGWPWCAMDSNGQWYAFRTEPVEHATTFSGEGDYVEIYLSRVPDWKKSKQKIAEPSK